MSFERNLILVSEQRHMDPADFARIAELVRDRAPDIEVFVTENGSPNIRTARAASQRPSIVICPTELDMFSPRRGRVFAGRWIGKIEELQRMEKAGLPVPRWTEITPDTKLDASEWGPAVIVKPSFGGGNREIALTPVADMRYQAAEEFPDEHRARKGAMLAQRFVHTGERPVEYRVLTLLGRPLYAIKQTSLDGAALAWPPDGPASLRTDVSCKGRRSRNRIHRRCGFAGARRRRARRHAGCRHRRLRHRAGRGDRRALRSGGQLQGVFLAPVLAAGTAAAGRGRPRLLFTV